MLTALIFTLTLAALALLMLLERMGVPASVAVQGSYAVMALAALAVAVINTTSRLGRFMIGHERGAALSATALVTTLLLGGASVFLALADPGPRLALLAAGWLVGLPLTGTRPWRNLRRPAVDPADLDPLAGGSGAAKVAQFAMLVLIAAACLQVWEQSRPVWTPVLPGSASHSLAPLALVAGMILVLGGMSGLARLALVALALIFATALPPTLIELAREAPLIAAKLTGFNVNFLASIPTPASLQAWLVFDNAGLVAFGLGLALGGASGQALAVLPGWRSRAASAGMALAMAALVCLLLLLADSFLHQAIEASLRDIPPAQWPAFVFDPAIRGWLTACGQVPQDPLAAAVACGTGTPRTLLPVRALVFDNAMARPALAVAIGWPVLAGYVWLVLPAWLALVGFLALLHSLATGLSERGLFRLLQPRALRSVRLGFGRMSVVALCAILAWLEMRAIRVPALAMAWLMLGAGLLLAIATIVRLTEWIFSRLSRRQPPVDHPATTMLEAS